MAILVTGAGGSVGREVVKALLKRDLDVIAAGRQADDIARRFGDAVRAVSLDFLDRATWPGALEGVERLFLMRPPAIAKVKDSINPFIDFATTRGVDHIVFLSVAGAGKNRLVPHRQVEDHLRGRGSNHTNLRPGFFAQNLQSAYRQDIVEDDRIFVPAGEAQPVNWIDTRDIADVAALILAAPAAHRGKDYTLTGPGAVPWSVVTGALSEALGRPIRYEAASVYGHLRHLSRRGLPRGAIIVQTILHVLLRFGQGAREDPTLAELLGRPGRTVQRYIHDHAEIWRRA